MATTYPLSSLAPTIDATGISAPVYNDIYQSLLAILKQIYGADIYVQPDSQDGQWIAALSLAIYNSNQSAIATFNAFSPSYAQGAGLSSLVKLNGLQRKIATNSTAVGNAVGQAGTIITNGVVKDVNGKLWDLPASVTIPISGTITITVTAQDVGNISAATGEINSIYNPQLGWQSFSNTAVAVPGTAVETDAELRFRQTQSVAMPAQTILASIASAIANIPGVSRYFVYENDTGSTDVNGLPAHSFSAVVQGGTSSDIAEAIALRKTVGSQTYGTTSVVVHDQYGLPTTINYYQLTQVGIYFAVTIKALPGYVATTGDALIAALVAFVNGLTIGEDVYLSQAQAAAQLIGLDIGQTFYVTDFRLGIAPSPTGTSNIVIAFNNAANCVTANVGLTVT
jgi:uncharacterized phage protein gp47/JayE